MKTSKSILFAAVLVFLGLYQAKAQDFQTGYFLGGYQYAYRLNPAFQSERAFFSLGMGQSGITTQSSLGLDNFLFVKDGKTCLFLNDKVSSEEFLSKLSTKENNLSLGINLNLLAIGFWVERNFFTLDVNIKSNNSITLPYDLFRFLKDGTSSGSSFDLSGTGLRSKNYMEAAIGWSRNWGNFISGGARLKTLVGLAEAQATMSKLSVVMNRDKWEVSAQGQLTGSSPALSVGTSPDGFYDFKQINMDAANLGPAGMGGALDLGISVNIFSWLTASAAVLDLGAMLWTHEVNGRTPEASYSWQPSQSQSIDIMHSGESNPMQEELDKIKEAFENIYKFQPIGPADVAMEMLPWRLNLGLEVRLPVYQRLSLGALYSLRNGQGFNWNEGRISLNWNPLNFLSLSGSTTINEIFKSYGFAFNLHPGVVNLFFGCDVIPARVISVNSLSDNLSMIPSLVGIPTGDLNVNGYFGLSINIGRRHTDYRKRIREEE